MTAMLLNSVDNRLKIIHVRVCSVIETRQLRLSTTPLFFPKRKRRAASGEIRTHDVLRARQTLYQLSHRGCTCTVHTMCTVPAEYLIGSSRTTSLRTRPPDTPPPTALCFRSWSMSFNDRDLPVPS